MSLRRGALLLILLTGALAILGQWDAGFARGWCLPAGILLLGLAWEAAALERSPVRLRWRSAERWRLGCPEPLVLAFRQDGRATLRIEVSLSAPDGICAVPRIERLTLPRALECLTTLEAFGRRLGTHRCPAPALRVQGALGLAWWRRTLTTGCEVTVVPDLSGGSGKARGARDRGMRAAGIVAAGTEIFDLREYRPGDPLRVIDWKASARRRRLISRELCEDQQLTLVVAIDAGRTSTLAAGALERLGLYINVASRLAQRAADQDDAVGLLVYAAQPIASVRPARGREAVARIRAVLADCRAQPGESNPVLAAARIRLMSRRRSLVVFLTAIEDAATTEQIQQAVRLLSPKHFVFVAGLESARIASFVTEPATDPLGAYRALAALDYGNALAGSVRSLRQLGAAALTARPEHLDRAVLDAYRNFRTRRRV